MCGCIVHGVCIMHGVCMVQCRYGVCMNELWYVHGVYCMGELRLSQCMVMGEQGYGGVRLWGSECV